MIRFDCDYTEGAHPQVLKALCETNMEQTPGYGLDRHCERARELIRRECGRDDLDIHFLVGGTQANVTVIASLLRPYQGVLCAATGHINGHETGALEATGHKALALPGKNGKISAKQVRKACREHREDASFEHVVQPGMAYISLPTEYGTLYTASELEEMHGACMENGIPLFIDGARLGYGLASDRELSLEKLSGLCDAFYIGGTKVGALFGEAVVFTRPELGKSFRYMIKRHGGMLAKGRLLGLQFEALFENGLYYQISENAIKTADIIKSALAEKGIPLFIESPTNQIFPILTKAQQAALGEKFVLSHWQKVDEERDALRICTSWATSVENALDLAGSILAL